MCKKIFSYCLLALCAAFCMVQQAKAAVSLEDGNAYRFVNVATGEALSRGTATTHDKFLFLEEPGDVGEDWTLGYIDKNVYCIYDAATRLAADMALSASDPGRVLLWEVNTTNNNQQFYFSAVDGYEDTYQICYALNHDKVLQAQSNGRVYMRDNVTDESALWRLELVKEAEPAIVKKGGFYTFTSVYNGKVISTGGKSDNDSPVIVETYADTDAQIWQTRPSSLTGCFLLYNKTARKNIDVALRGARTPLLYISSDTENQRATITLTDEPDVVQISYNYSTYLTYFLYVTASGALSLTTNGDLESTKFRVTEAREPDDPIAAYWEDETVFEQNKEAGHAWQLPYRTKEEMRADAAHYQRPWEDPTGSSRWMTLNGLWKVDVVKEPSQAPGEADFYGDLVDVEEWETITVPSCLEMKGFTEPYYINVNYPFQNNPPFISMKYDLPRPVASYRRNFTLPEGWLEDRTLLHFDGIYSAAYIWVNGRYVGYTQGANNDAEFDITAHVREGENNVSVQVYRWSDGSYLEGQDMWHMSGIHRDVYLVSQPRTWARDHSLVAKNFASNFTKADLEVTLTVDNRDAAATTKKFDVALYDADGEQVATQQAEVVFTAGQKSQEVTLTMEGLTDVKTWTAEKPYLYTVEFVQSDAENKQELAWSTKFGFRDVRIQGTKLYVNGKSIFIRGVNTQDTHPMHGRSIDVPTMLKDVILMKQANVNTIRTSHYPRQAKMYAMMDYYGLYCMDEADNECHASWDQGSNIQNVASWRPAFMDRMQRMVLRDRNFPSIIMWSSGNESGAGTAHQAMYSWTKQFDPTRPVHYEGATRGGLSGATDFRSLMYPSFGEHSSSCNNTSQPYIACEYAHAMGQAIGSLQDYWDTWEASKAGIGGCIWDWVDQSIYDAEDIKKGTLTENGYPKFRTGNDYNGPHQGNFVNNGILTATREWNGKLTEVKKVYQCARPKTFNTSMRILTVENAYAFTNLEGYEVRSKVMVNGQAREYITGTLPAIAPGATGVFAVNYTQDWEAGDEVLLNVEIRLPEETAWAPAGYAIGANQFVIQERAATLPEVRVNNSLPALTFTESSRTVRGQDFTIVFNQNGVPTSWTNNEQQLLMTPPTLDLYRWIENDNPYGNGNGADPANGISTYTPTFTPSADGSTFTVKSEQRGTKVNVVYTYIIYKNGVVDVKVEYSPLQSDIYRLGTLWTLRPGLENITYYARGPWSNFNDRNTGSFLGTWSTTATEMYEDFAHPQTCGYRTDLRSLTLLNTTTAKGMRIDVEGQASFQALRYDDKTMHDTRHSWNLTPSYLYLHLDYMQRGLGNNSCGGEVARAEYRVPSSGTYAHTLRFTPLQDVDTSIEENVAEPALTVPLQPTVVYDLQGRRVASPVRGGIYIVNGKKTIF